MTTKKNNYHHGNLREAVLEAAHKLLELEGIKSITFRRIAKEVGVSQNAPYSHFKDKTALLEALAVDGFHGLLDSMRENSVSLSTPSDYLQAIGKGYVTYALSNPALFKLMFDMQSATSESGMLQTVSSQSFQILRDAVSNVQVSNKQDRADELIASISAWALVQGLSVLLIENRLSANPEAQSLKSSDIIEQSTRIFTQGLINFKSNGLQ
ncbi:TetR/AcrR family transcriptional regulator [Vibrio sp. SCSIO 43169]|uniref:TetR/AcrR family transcriptional regulator n=1 Tax=Vibrio sp. SCSIO 43169 TaxID=2822801 RepID=UPI002042E531|nr:TetR/AcrR family transcriptional regulator [Vibrio sp. SCSIO 43169]MCM5511074.1 TetR/AcrR family transcriptional regulator [Vibrio sp. SCSIO 43169]